MNPAPHGALPPLRRAIRFSGTSDVRILAYEPERMPRVRWADADPTTLRIGPLRER